MHSGRLGSDRTGKGRVLWVGWLRVNGVNRVGGSGRVESSGGRVEYGSLGR